MKNQRFAARRLTAWILSILMILTLTPVMASASSGSVAADGTYTGSGRVSFSKDTYSFDVTVTVSSGKITNLTSTLTSTPKESKSKSSYHPRAVSALLSALKGKEASSSTVDAVSSGTPKYSYSALKTAVSEVLSANAGSGSDSSSESDSGSSSGSDTGSSSGSSTAAGTVPDGSYTGNGTVSFSKDHYSFSATVTVSGGKFTGLTSTLTSTPEESKSKSEYHPKAVSALLKNLSGKDATSSTVDAVSSGTPKYSYSALKSVVSEIVTANASSGSDSTEQTGDIVITNPAAVTGSDLSLSKVLSYDENSSSYTITLTGKATASADSSEYTRISTSKDYTYNTLTNGSYYYSYDGSHFYVLKGYQKKYDKYYINAYVGRRYLGLEDDGDFHKADSDPDEGDDVESKYEVFLESGDFHNTYLYQKTGSSGTSYGTSCVLKDTVNTTNFDTSSASAARTSGSGTVSFSQSTGVLSVTGYDYSGNYGGSPLVVQISGLKAKNTGTIESNSGNAGIYASSSASSPIVSISSPTAEVPEAAETYSYTVTFRAVNGSFSDGSSTASATLTGSSNTLYLSEDQIPAAGSKPDSGYNAGSWDTVPSTSTAITGDTTFTYTYIKDTVDAAADGIYIDATGTVTVEDTGDTYVPRVTVTVENGKITALTAAASETNSTNQSYLEDAVSGISSQIVGRTANSTTSDSIDTVSGATCSSRAVIADIKAALASENLIQWCDADGTVLEKAYVSTGTMPVYTGTEPSKEGCSFTGWNPEVTVVSGSQTYTAQYTSAANSYTVTWVVGSDRTTTSVTEGEQPVSGLTPAKEGYVFAGWASSADAAVGIRESSLPAVTADITYYAIFTVPSITGNVYLNSSVKNETTGGDYYYPLLSVFTDESGVITDVTASADTTSSYSQTCLSRALSAVKDVLNGKTADQAKSALSGFSPDAVSGATNSATALKQAAVLALNGDPVSADDYTLQPDIYNYSARIENGFSLQKTLTKEEDGTYSIELRAYAVDPMEDKLNHKASTEETTVDGRDIVLVLDQSKSMYLDFYGVEESISGSSGSETTYTETASATYTFTALKNKIYSKDCFILFSDGNYYSLTAFDGNGNGKNNYVYFTVNGQTYYLTTSGSGYTTSENKVKDGAAVYKGKLYTDPVTTETSSSEGVTKGSAKFEVVKSAVSSWLGGLGEADTVQYVGYSDTASVLNSLNDYSADSSSSYTKNVNAGIEKAQTLLSSDDRSKVIIVISDNPGSWTDPDGVTMLSMTASENMSLDSLALPDYSKTTTVETGESTPASGGETMSYVLKDTVNTDTFDVTDAVSAATWSAARNKVTFDKDTGIVTASGYDYAFVYWEDVVRDGNPAGTDPFKVTITGLKLKKESGSWISSNDQNAGIYSSSDSSSPLISIVSPLLNL